MYTRFKEVAAMASQHDVAAYILAKQGKMSTMKLQKLLYYSQAWHLVWEEEPLFDADFQAWANGPVLPGIYKLHRGKYSVTAWPQGDPAKLTEDEANVVDIVLEHYGPLAGNELSTLTHREPPWRDARGDLRSLERGGNVIEKDDIRDYYISLKDNPDAKLISQLDLS